MLSVLIYMIPSATATQVVATDTSFDHAPNLAELLSLTIPSIDLAATEAEREEAR